jgi:tetratricopeptide (TPR) repeat protein
MELHKAIKEIVASKGADMIRNPQIINYLLDYQAFKEKPATKLILRAIIDSGYAENIMVLASDKKGWEVKFKQYQHEFIDSCGYKEELAAYVFEAIAYGLGLVAANVEPEIKAKFNVDSFFDIPEVEQKQPPASPQPQQKPTASPSDLYTIALSFFNEGKYQQSRGFMEKALTQYPQSNVPALYLKLMGDINMKIGSYQEALQYYNDCFVRKAAESKMTIDQLRESLKQHKVKGFENSMFCYFFCMYYAKGMSDAQWLKFVKDEARYCLVDAIRYCADKGINPIDDHFNIYFVDKNQLRNGDYLFDDGSFSHEIGTSKKTIGRIALSPTSDYEQSQGWTHGYIIFKEPLGRGSIMDALGIIFRVVWSINSIDMPFPHSHYTLDDINHWDEIDRIESEHYISIDNFEEFPAFKAIKMMNSLHPVPISGTSGWLLPSIHHFKRIIKDNKALIPDYAPPLNNGIRVFISGVDYWTSSQASEKYAVSLNSSYRNFSIRGKENEGYVLPIAAF